MRNIYCLNRSLKLVTTVGYTGSHACGLLYQMEVDFILRYKNQTRQEEARRISKY